MVDVMTETAVNFNSGWWCPVNDIQWSQNGQGCSFEATQQSSTGEGDVVSGQR